MPTRKERLARRQERQRKDMWLSVFCCSLARKADDIGRAKKRPDANAKMRFIARAIHDQLGRVDLPPGTPKAAREAVVCTRKVLYLNFAAWIYCKCKALKRLAGEGKLAEAAAAINCKYKKKRRRARRSSSSSSSSDSEDPEGYGEVAAWSREADMPCDVEAAVLGDLAQDYAFWGVAGAADRREAAGGLAAVEWRPAGRTCGPGSCGPLPPRVFQGATAAPALLPPPADPQADPQNCGPPPFAQRNGAPQPTDTQNGEPQQPTSPQNGVPQPIPAPRN